jgi:hypothetical protein
VRTARAWSCKRAHETRYYFDVNRTVGGDRTFLVPDLARQDTRRT